jgi:hypothetical protein
LGSAPPMPSTTSPAGSPPLGPERSKRSRLRAAATATSPQCSLCGKAAVSSQSGRTVVPDEVRASLQRRVALPLSLEEAGVIRPAPRALPSRPERASPVPRRMRPDPRRSRRRLVVPHPAASPGVGLGLGQELERGPLCALVQSQGAAYVLEVTRSACDREHCRRPAVVHLSVHLDGAAAEAGGDRRERRRRALHGD